ncbi:MAG: glycosyltransferase family 4 protein [Deltaproteobacteria bacterium]|nr:glycosyltransferase family 4 protein [Deltaproteobacteria bacterium]
MNDPAPLCVLVSRYPAISHTFIRREIEALRALGVQVETASLRTPGEDELLVEIDRQEHQRTFYVQPVRPFAVMGAVLRAFVLQPARTMATARLAFRHRKQGIRGLVWAAFHLVEALYLSAELRRRGVRHIHSHFANAGGTVGLLASKQLGIGWSLTLHGLSDFGDPVGQRLREKFELARLVVCVSEHGRQQALEITGGKLADRIHVVRCGLGEDAFEAAASSASQEGPLKLVCVGRLAPEKGHAGLLDALAEARALGLDAELRLIGEGPERAALEQRVRKLGLEAQVVLPGARGGSELRKEFAAADLFVLSSLMEGLPVTLMEALATGTPVIAPRLSGIPELVRDEQDGWLFATGRFDQLAQALIVAQEKRSRLPSMGAEGREQVRGLHDARRSGEQLKELLAATGAWG